MLRDLTKLWLKGEFIVLTGIAQEIKPPTPFFLFLSDYNLAPAFCSTLSQVKYVSSHTYQPHKAAFFEMWLSMGI